MLLLAADTSGKHGSIALARLPQQSTSHQNSEQIEVIETVPLAGGTFSAQLVPQIAALLSKHGFTKEDIGAFAVVSGPGSFTGLRVGLAAIKALAEVLGKPIAAVSLLEAVSTAGQSHGRVMAALEAGRDEVYAGEYEVAERAEMLNERLLTKDEFVASAEGWTVVTSDQSIADMARNAGLAVRQVEHPRSDAIARLGWQKFRAGKTVSPEQLEANYIRRSDAEIFSKSG